MAEGKFCTETTTGSKLVSEVPNVATLSECKKLAISKSGDGATSFAYGIEGSDAKKCLLYKNVDCTWDDTRKLDYYIFYFDAGITKCRQACLDQKAAGCLDYEFTLVDPKNPVWDTAMTCTLYKKGCKYSATQSPLMKLSTRITVRTELTEYKEDGC